MGEYYVVRDKNTGLYFRGKGVNRWGKYYNQASIYRIRANAENTVKEVSWRGEQAEIVPIQITGTTSDVVEVVRCKDCKYLKYGYQCYCPLGMNLSNNEDAYVLVNANKDFCSYGTPKERGGEK